MTVGTKSYAPVRINKGQQQEIAEYLATNSYSSLGDEQIKNLTARMILDILGWDVTTHPRFGLRLERQN